jgi:glycosyltransferase involved in cell wall biosynthesis
MSPLRIAFVSDEFVTECPDAGGLAGYLSRMTQTLVERGHEVEVFTRTFDAPRSLEWNGVQVTAVPPCGHGRRGPTRHLARWLRGGPAPGFRARLRSARSLARAFAARDRARPFDVVQSANCSLCGLLLPRRPGLRHLMRMSSSRELWVEGDARSPNLDDRLVGRAERFSMRRAHRVYAPSRFLADHFDAVHGLEVAVLPPPVFVECKPAEQPPASLPDRFLLHFGNLMPRKGTEWLARALPVAWAREPELRMVWAGREVERDIVARSRARWGEGASRVRYLGALERADLYAVLGRAAATVLPSRVDNLPNTVAESLAFSVPVIGSRGASIDELVEDGSSGALVPIDDVGALADALVRAWRGGPGWLGAGFRRPAALDRLTPGTAADGLIRLALEDSGS